MVLETFLLLIIFSLISGNAVTKVFEISLISCNLFIIRSACLRNVWGIVNFQSQSLFRYFQFYLVVGYLNNDGLNTGRFSHPQAECSFSRCDRVFSSKINNFTKALVF